MSITSIKDIKDFFEVEEEKDIVSPNGVQYRIRILEPVQFMESAQIPLLYFSELKIGRKTDNATIAKQIKDLDIGKNVKPLLMAAIVKVGEDGILVDKNKKDLEENEISVASILRKLGEALWLYTQILVFSREAMDGSHGGASAKIFSGDSTGSVGTVRPDGDEIRSVTESSDRPAGETVVNGSV